MTTKASKKERDLIKENGDWIDLMLNTLKTTPEHMKSAYVHKVIKRHLPERHQPTSESLVEEINKFKEYIGRGNDGVKWDILLDEFEQWLHLVPQEAPKIGLRPGEYMRDNEGNITTYEDEQVSEGCKYEFYLRGKKPGLICKKCGKIEIAYPDDESSEQPKQEKIEKLDLDNDIKGDEPGELIVECLRAIDKKINEIITFINNS